MMGLQLHQHNNINVEYLLFDDEYSAEDRNQYASLPVHRYSVKGPRKLGWSPDLYRQIKTIKPDIVHTQSLWMYLSYANKQYHGRTGIPYIISPHGMLDKWQLKQSFWKDLKKDIVLGLYERKHLEGAACLHALCREEYDAIRAFGLKNPVAIIPNGVEIAEPGPRAKAKDNDHKNKLLYIGRIHTKKGLDNLLKAWSLLPSGHDWELIIAGETKDEGYQQSLLQKLEQLNIHATVSFVGGKYGAAKQKCFNSSDAFILPSFSEGLPMSVLEAWSYGLPVLITPECNLTEGYGRNAAIRIEANPESICDGIKKMMSMQIEQRVAIGEQGLALVKEKFSWSQVANSMTQLYNWALGNEKMPDFVF
jgi:poly(glycerol-phosphate) alpha-glucosyltransferase